MKQPKELKLIKKLYDIIEELEIMCGLSLEIKVIKPKQYFGKGLLKETINAQELVNKLSKK